MPDDLAVLEAASWDKPAFCVFPAFITGMADFRVDDAMLSTITVLLRYSLHSRSFANGLDAKPSFYNSL